MIRPREPRVPLPSDFGKDREIIRKHARSSRTEHRTTGSSATTSRVRVGGALAGVRGDPILPRNRLSGIPEAA
jgi:hypothetical protein